jgi:NADP-dependent 3-hydroxy acid dehydrogenase YdfG
MADGRVVVITGASAGIGAAAARAFASRGWRVALAARRVDELEAVARDCAEAAVIPTDVTVRADVERLRDAAVARFGHVDCWINNAGVGIVRPALQLTDDDLDRMWLVNTKSVLYGMQAIVPHFQARGAGLVVNVSSVLGRAPVASVRSAYCAAKAAMDSLTRSVRADLAAFPDIHVALFVPGIVETGFGRTAAATSGEAPAGPPQARPSLPAGVAPQSVDVVVEALLDLVANPRAEVYTNPVSQAFVAEYLRRQGAIA